VTTTAGERKALLGPPPRVLAWPAFDAEAYRTVRQGDHQLFVGPTQSGKTVLCRGLVRHRDYVVVWGTKKRDTSLDAYTQEGYVRVDRWPPSTCLEEDHKGRLVRKPYRWPPKPDAEGKVRLILWPEISTRTDLKRHADQYARCLDDAFIQGGWSIVIDETLWATRPTGLGLNAAIAEIAFGAASNKVSLYLCMQRPTGMERVTWSSVSDAYVFKSGIIDDIRELAALGTQDPRDAVTVLRTQISGHRFLHLPTRGQSRGWSISEVDPRVI
jgi:hypothetical protein